MFSQFAQDLFVLEALRWKRNGFFLDCGAADGVLSSNTRLLEEFFGWNGICIEPNNIFFGALVQNRRCFCVNCCLYDKECTVEFLENANTLGGILEAYHPSLLKYAKSTFNFPEDAKGRPLTVRKTAHTLRSVLRRFKAPQIIDYWSLDTEGSEFAILKSFPFDEYSFRVLTVEHNRYPIRNQIREFLEDHGYILIKEFVIDDCYAKGVDLERPSWRSNVWNRLGRGRGLT